MSLALSSIRPLGIAHLGRSFSLAVVPHVQQWSPHIIHCHDAECGLAALQLSENPSTQLVYDSHELWTKRNTPAHRGALGKLVRRWEHRVEERLVQRSDLVIAVSPGIAQRIQAQYKLTEDSVAVVRNIPVAVPFTSGAIKLSDFRESPHEYLVAYSGRITNRRYLHDLIEATSRLTSYRIALILLGYGNSDYVEAIQRHARALGIRLVVVAPVPTDSVVRTLSSADAVFVGVDPVVESYLLSLPNKFFEALLSGRPVVFPALPEMLQTAQGVGGMFPFHVSQPFSLDAQLTAALAASHEAPFLRDRNIHWEAEARILLRNYSLLRMGSAGA
jgi:glycosyltransferase involved in cell wall biosynthesis